MELRIGWRWGPKQTAGRKHAARRAIRISAPAETTELQPDCDPDAGARNRSDHGRAEFDSGRASDSSSLPAAAAAHAGHDGANRRAADGRPARVAVAAMDRMAERSKIPARNRRLQLDIQLSDSPRRQPVDARDGHHEGLFAADGIEDGCRAG